MSTSNARERTGFTLIEMLAVIGILALLAALILPAIMRAVERSRRVQCLANVRELARVATLSAEDLEGLFPNIHSDASPYMYWYSYKKATAWAEKHGLTRSQCYCPSNRDWNKDSYWNWSGSGVDSVWGYFYFADDNGWPSRGGNTWPGVPAGVQLFARRTSDAPYFNILMADLTRRYQGQWGAGANHGDDPADGGNQVRLDGSAAWVPWGEMTLHYKGGGVEGYW